MLSATTMLTKLFDKLRKRSAKKQVIDAVLKSEQQHKGVVNVYRNDKTNVGDYYCGPHHYFPELNAQPLDMYNFHRNNKRQTNEWIEAIADNALIIGGGGVLNRSSFEMQMQLFEKLANAGKKIIVWGAGHNEKKTRGSDLVKTYNVNPNAFELFGVRDYGRQEEWVPCVSCMHTIFDQKFEVSNEVGLVIHKKTIDKPDVLEKFESFPQTTNTEDIETVVSFIASCETIVANSYHAMYWATLLGKKVLVVPNSSKFYDFKYKPVFTTFDDFRAQLDEAQSYTGVLEECRAVNIDFSKKVFDCLDL